MKLLRILRAIAGAIAVALATWWTLEAMRVPRPVYGVDPETGLRLRVGPLTAGERAAAQALEEELAATAEIRL